MPRFRDDEDDELDDELRTLSEVLEEAFLSVRGGKGECGVRIGAVSGFDPSLSILGEDGRKLFDAPPKPSGD
jgi:hypothetical protein